MSSRFAWLDVQESASLRRAISKLRVARTNGELAILLGAGADIAIFKEANQQVPGWIKLMEELAKGVGLSQTENLLKNWPTEMACLYRAFLGNHEFKQRIADATCPDFTPNLNGCFSLALAELAVSTNLIITLNYTPAVRMLVEAYLANKNLHKQLVCLDREDLPAFQFPLAEPNPKQIYLVHLHGRVSSLSEPIFDAWGYNVVSNEDPEYRPLLRRVFEQRCVFSVGVSWVDVPLRNEAAFVRRTKGFASIEHLMINRINESEKADYVPGGPAATWCKAMATSYNVIVQPAEDKDIPRVMSQICTSPTTGASLDLPDLADYFDEAGDFESVAQHRYILGGEGFQAHQRSSRLEEICDRCEDFLNAKGDWLVLARLERHLRHHIFLCEREMRKRFLHGKEMTSRTWMANLVFSAAQESIGKLDDPHLAYDALTGITEVLGEKEVFTIQQEYPDVNWGKAKVVKSDIAEKLFEIAKSNKELEKRLKVVPYIWKPGRAKYPVDENFVQDLLKCGCESMAAKVILDGADYLALNDTAELDPTERPRKIREYSERAALIAKAAGHRRREVKAHVLMGMWHEDPRQGRLLLLGDSLSQANQLLESSLLDGLATGLVVCFVRSIRSNAEKEKLDLPALLSVFREAGITTWDTANVRSYWISRAPSQERNCIMAALQS